MQNVKGFIFIVFGLILALSVLLVSNQLLQKNQGIDYVTSNIVGDKGVQSIQVSNDEAKMSLNLYDHETKKDVMNYLESRLTNEEYENYDIEFIGNKILSKPEEANFIEEKLMNNYDVRDIQINHENQSLQINLPESVNKLAILSYLKRSITPFDFENYDIEFVSNSE